ncbi:cytochrome P450 [Dactylonectria estremocensis]|uniref:Cytochrome P450 n=1 Tax=Dactylonectria estremocensis TaxID=1079267 RepID=A0A9P9ERV3_9HYPO|nr:cytochrome P450 [Dactylonectria estremocensis]
MGHTSMAATHAAAATETPSAAKVLLLLLLPFVLTYIWTVAGNRGYRLDAGSRQPPKVPYWIPVAGNTFGFAFNTEKFLTSIISKFGNVPLRILVGAEPMYFIPHGEPILELFKASRHLTTKSLGVMTVRDAFGCPQKDIDDIYGADDSGTEAKPAPGWESVDPSVRFHFIQHRDIHNLLTGSSLNTMTAKFVEVYSKRIERDTRFKDDEWSEVDDLYAWLKDNLIRAAIEALCGEKFLELAPDFPDDFWAFDYHLPNLFKRLPRWLVPKSYQARDKVHEAVLRYHEYGRTQFNFTDDEVLKRDWTPEFGARLMGARQKMFTTTGFSAQGAAALDLGMMWAVNANAIPVVIWMMLGILLDSDIKDRVMAEIEPTFHENSLSFDINRLCAAPLLNSIYCETLRVRVAAPVGRASLIPNLKFGKWQMKQGVGMLSTSWMGGHDESFWNAGRVFADGSAEHPVDSFWAERFLQYRDDPTSGPIRKQDGKATTVQNPKKRTVEDDRNARVVTEGMQGHWYPYGGGTKMCPGRFFAKQELMAGVSVVLRAFEIELLDHSTASKVRPNMDYFPFGTIPPKGKVAVRIKRRKLRA